MDGLRALVRPVVTLALVAAVIVGFFMRLIPPEPFMAAVLLVLGFWFGSRATVAPAVPCPKATTPNTPASSAGGAAGNWRAHG